MSGCTIFSHFTDREKVHARMVNLYGAEAIQLEGSPSDWTRLTITRKKLFRTSTLTINAMPDEGPEGELADMVKKMHHVFQSIPAENTEIQKKLLIKISTIRLALGLVSNRRMDDWEEAIFGAAKDLDALVFWNGQQMLNAKGHVILDFKGRVRVSDLEVHVGADLPDADLPQSEEALARKARSEADLSDHKVPVNLNLPVIADTETATLRTATEIADRALALCLVALKGEGLDAPILAQVADQFGILPLLSPSERAFIEDPAPEQQTLTNFAWRYEALAVMLWAIGHQETLPYPDAICDVQALVTTIRNAGSRAGLHTSAHLRSPSEILDAADLVFRQNWACVDARLRQEPAPAQMLSGVVLERNTALNWLRGNEEGDWEE